jgi:hypothetical protein
VHAEQLEAMQVPQVDEQEAETVPASINATTTFILSIRRPQLDVGC